MLSSILFHILKRPITYNNQIDNPKMIMIIINNINNNSLMIITLIMIILTLKWLRGVPMDPKISFHASARKRIVYSDAAVSWLLHAYQTASSGMCLKWKNRASRCAAIALGSLWTPVDHQRDTRQKSFSTYTWPVTFDLWWLYVNVDLWYYHISILIKTN